MLEAAACCLPAVVTDIAGAREVLPDLRSDQTAPVGDEKALAAAMQTLMCLPETERRDLGLRNHASVCGRFNMDEALNQWENFYNLQLERNPQRSRFGMSARSTGRTRQLQ